MGTELQHVHHGGVVSVGHNNAHGRSESKMFGFTECGS
jgi:hypothetical protein